MSGKRVKNRIVLITGAGSGVGKATALLFVNEGAIVVLVGRRKGVLTRLSNKILRGRGKAIPMEGDVTNERDVQGIIQTTLQRFGRIDILINNAGVAREAVRVHETTDDMWSELMDINLTGAFRMIRAVLPHLIERRRGTIVNVSSIAGLVGLSHMAAYSVAKSGMIALTKSVAVEYGHLGIRCNCVCPGTVETEMTKDYLSSPGRYQGTSSLYPMGRIAHPKEIAQGILYLASEESSFVTGTVLTIDGGYTAK